MSSHATTTPLSLAQQMCETRADTMKAAANRYTAGESIKQIAAAYGRSYGWAHNILEEAGVQFRKRGGRRRTADAQTDSPDATTTHQAAPAVGTTGWQQRTRMTADEQEKAADEVLRLYTEERKSVRQITVQTGLRRGTVNRLLNLRNVERRSRNGGRRSTLTAAPTDGVQHTEPRPAGPLS
ncbi:helix-turn-helix domain-containing protein [Actinoplanes oblitus]|uniref:Helix-turn-helix domain-containing protein n=1 Tax=Actinoplanes oblitus TaxID=3040509 RepID=A0ABY8WSK6_9ACTN|nr:helix-turn-helix domain-containing protein [Actinoplanes oblitus]WIN00084.1 helix-turn-helix domain-containing protein [Actinoplanes oblitus]